MASDEVFDDNKSRNSKSKSRYFDPEDELNFTKQKEELIKTIESLKDETKEKEE